jgi:hypothetical protein
MSSMLTECWIVTLLWSKIVSYAHFEYCIACRYNYFCNGTYEISQESAEDILEDQVNVTKGLFKAPNQSSEDLNFTDFSPTSKGKPRCTSQYFKLLQFHYYDIYLALRLGVEMKP